MELWAYDTRTGAKTQILPERLTHRQGAPRVWEGADGQVYGRADGSVFLCQPDRVVIGKSAPAKGKPPLRAGDKIVDAIATDGRLELTDSQTRQVSWLPTEYEGRRAFIFSVGCERDGKIYGSTALPGNSFC